MVIKTEIMILNNLKKYKVILASGSPRRHELLEGLGIDFKVEIIKDIDESYPENIPAKETSLYIARKKAEAYKSLTDSGHLVITADTVVVCNETVLGKPSNEEEAVKMLKLLSGKTHQVITGVAISTKEKTESFAVTTDVKFSAISDEEIYYYIDKYKPFDKAGAYGIQEWIGYIGVEYISGSYYNVMGLPIQRLYRELKKF